MANLQRAIIFAMAIHKGGVGKTTLALLLADAFAREGQDVLLVDLDPQANLTKLVYSREVLPPVPVSQVLEEQAMVADAIIQKTRIDHVHLLAASLALTQTELVLGARSFGTVSILRRALDTVRPAYDVIIIDAPPALSKLTANALGAADVVLVPVESGGPLAMMGAQDMRAYITQAQTENPNLKQVFGVLNMHDGRKKLCRMTEAAMPQYFPDMLGATVPASEEIRKAQAMGKTILQTERDHSAAKAVITLTQELMRKTGLERKERVNGDE